MAALVDVTVKPGQTFNTVTHGVLKTYQAGETVKLEAAEAERQKKLGTVQ